MTTGTGKWCANGKLTWNEEDTNWGDLSHGMPRYAVCNICHRRIRVLKYWRIAPHVWQPVNPNVDVGDTSTNSQSNLAQRAFERTRK